MSTAKSCWVAIAVAGLLIGGCGDSTSNNGGEGGQGAAAGAGAQGGGGGTGGTPFARPDEPGPFAVGHTAFTATDAARGDRVLPVDVWYPVDKTDPPTQPTTMYLLQNILNLPSPVAIEEAPVSSEGPLVLLIFSHGFGGINTQSTQLMETIASHGFIVASPSHTGNVNGDTGDTMPAEKRVPDVSFIIDTMFARNNAGGDLFEGTMDETKVGALGHSFGGSTALGSVAGWAGAQADPRVAAAGVIAGGVGMLNFDESTLQAVTAPTIFLVGTLDENALENHDYAYPLMTSAAARYKVEVTDATHTHFANICQIGNALIDIGLGPETWPGTEIDGLIAPFAVTCGDDAYPIGEAHRLQDLYMVAFFRHHMLGDAGYDVFLGPAYADANEPAVSVVVPE